MVLRRVAVVACSAVSSIHQSLTLKDYHLCVLHICCRSWSNFCFSPITAMAVLDGSWPEPWLFCLSFVSVFLVGHLAASLALSCVRLSIFQRWSSTEPQDAFPLLSSEKISLVGGPCIRTDVYPTSEAAVRMFYVIIFPSPQHKTHFSVVCPCQVCLANARFMVPLWLGFGQDLIRGERSTGEHGGGRTVLARFPQVCCWSSLHSMGCK